MCKTFNNMIDLTSFPAVLYLQLAHIIPVSKKGYENSIKNYRPVNVLANILRIYERYMCKQIIDYLGNVFSKFQCWFCQGFSE